MENHNDVYFINRLDYLIFEFTSHIRQIGHSRVYPSLLREEKDQTQKSSLQVGRYVCNVISKSSEVNK